MTTQLDDTTVLESVIESARTILQIPQSGSQYNILTEVADLVLADALRFTGLENTETNLAKIQNILVYMLIEKYNSINDSGLSSLSIGGITESFKGDYSNYIKSQLKDYKRLKVL